MKKFWLILLAVLLTASFASAEGGFKSSLFDSEAMRAGEDVETDISATEEIFYEEDSETASAVDISAEELKDCLTSYFDYADIGYLENEYGDITLEYPLTNGIKSLYFEITCFTNGYTAYAYPLLYADETNMVAVAEFFHRANFGMRNGNFELDFNDGEIRYKTYVDCTDYYPGDNVIQRSIDIPAEMFEAYGDGLLSVMEGTFSAGEAIAEIEG